MCNFIAAIEKHFEDFNEDQFDFHAYCIRKVTLRAYLQVLRWEDTLWGHDIYADAAEAIISIYLDLFDNPPKLLDDIVEPDYSKMTPAERKKAKAQARKKKKKAEKKAEEESKNDAKNKSKNSGDTPTPPKDPDPDGKELLKLDPLEQAKKYISTLRKNAPNRLSTWLLQYDVCIRRKKYLMALEALNKAIKIEGYLNNGEIFSRMVDFASLDVEPYGNKDIQAVFESEKKTLYGQKSLTDFVTDTATRVNDLNSNLSFRIAVAKALTKLKVGNPKDACLLITKNGLNMHGVTVGDCIDSKQFLDNINDVDECIEKLRDDWKESLKSKFFFSSQF